MVRKEAKGMVNKIEGKLVTNGEKFCIIVGRFNEFIGSKLLSGAIDTLVRHNVCENNIDVVWTPGAFNCKKSCKVKQI